MKKLILILAVCICCMLSFVGCDEIAGHKHTYTETVTEPTCTEKGVKTFTCNCGNSFTVELGLIPHTPTIVQENVINATCDEKGSYDEVTYCEICEKELSRESKELEALGHNYESEVKEPTCTEQGYTTYTCTRCEDSYIIDYTDVVGHTPAEATKEIKVQPTCTGNGLYDSVVYCETCGEELSREENIIIEHFGHNYIAEVVKPTCKEQGYTAYVCENCGEIEKTEDYTEATHNHLVGYLEDGTAFELNPNNEYTIDENIQYFIDNDTIRFSGGIKPENEGDKAFAIIVCEHCGSTILLVLTK